MSKLNIKVTDVETGETKELDTEGFLLLYLEQEQIKMQGKLGLKSLTPILTKIVLERLSK